MNYLQWWFLLMSGAVLGVSWAASDTPTSTPTPEPVTSTTMITTTMSSEERCARANASCEECVRITACYYCKKTDKCAFYKYKHIFPNPDECDMGDVRWGVCWFNFKVMVISMAVVGGILIISLITCICCCCRTRKNKKLIQEEAKYEREREERRIRNSQKQKEKQTKYDEIRRKYGILEGLMKDDNPYQRFEA